MLDKKKKIAKIITEYFTAHAFRAGQPVIVCFEHSAKVSVNQMAFKCFRV